MPYTGDARLIGTAPITWSVTPATFPRLSLNTTTERSPHPDRSGTSISSVRPRLGITDPQTAYTQMSIVIQQLQITPSTDTRSWSYKNQLQLSPRYVALQME